MTDDSLAAAAATSHTAVELLVVAAARMPVRDPSADAAIPLYHVSLNTPSFSHPQCVTLPPPPTSPPPRLLGESAGAAPAR